MLVVCCVLGVGCCLSVLVCGLLFDDSLSVDGRVLVVVCCLLFGCLVLVVVRCSMCVVRCVLSVVCSLLFVMDALRCACSLYDV